MIPVDPRERKCAQCGGKVEVGLNGDGLYDGCNLDTYLSDGYELLERYSPGRPECSGALHVTNARAVRPQRPPPSASARGAGSGWRWAGGAG